MPVQVNISANVLWTTLSGPGEEPAVRSHGPPVPRGQAGVPSRSRDALPRPKRHLRLQRKDLGTHIPAVFAGHGRLMFVLFCCCTLQDLCHCS